MDKRNASMFGQADKALKFTPQERALYQHHLANAGGPGGVDNADGSRSTLYAMTIEANDKAYIVPTVFGGKILEADAAMEHASKIGLDKFPAYPSAADADARYDEIHKFMEQEKPTTIGAGKVRKMAADRRSTIMGDQGGNIIGDY